MSPSRLSRACSQYGCPNPEPCPLHGRAATKRRYEAFRGSGADRGYDARWRKFKAWYLDEQIRQNIPRAGLCGSRLNGLTLHPDSECAKLGLVVIGSVLDHLVPVTGPDDPSFYDPHALGLLCDKAHGGRGCHDRKRQKESLR